MRTDHLDADLEALADGSLAIDAQARAHLDACPLCAGRLADARAIEGLLASREMAVPPAGFTMAVVTRVNRERWQAERVVDIGFNLAIAAGALLIVGGGLGLAWSAGLLTVRLDLPSIVAAASVSWVDRLIGQAQTVASAAVLLSMALGVWWWAEADPTL